MLGPTDLLESNEDMTFSISVLSVGLTKKEILDLFLKKSEKCLCENEVSNFVLLAIEEQLLKIWEISTGLEIVVPSTIRVLWISAEVFLIFRIYRFYAFPCVFNAVPIGFKIMIVVVRFTLFEKCRKHVSVVFIFLMIPFFYLWIFCSYEFFLVSCF